jgi:hypothetical protein
MLHLEQRGTLLYGGAFALAVLCLILPDANVIRVVAGLILVCVLPGLGVWLNVDRGINDIARAVALVPGYSFAVSIIVGALLAVVGVFSAATWVVAITAVTVGLLKLAEHRGRLTSTQGFGLPNVFSRFSFAEAYKRPVLQLGVGMLAITGVITVSSYLSDLHREFPVTEFWMVPDNDEAGTATIGIHNLELSAKKYNISVYTNGRFSATWPDIELAPGATWVRKTRIPASANGAGEARAELFLAGEGRARLYRSVWTSGHQPGIPAKSSDKPSQ